MRLVRIHLYITVLHSAMDLITMMYRQLLKTMMATFMDRALPERRHQHPRQERQKIAYAETSNERLPGAASQRIDLYSLSQ